MSDARGPSSPTSSTRPLDVALAAAREAGEILLAQLGRIRRDEVGRKSAARDLVTAADLAAERAIVARIRAAFPDDAIEAEEEVHEPVSTGRDERPRWFVDPLDGTVNFVHELPVFAVSIARYVGGVPEIAVVHAPRLGETFSAALGRGATLNGQKIAVSGAATLGESVLATGFPYRRNELRAEGRADNLANFDRLFYEVRGMRRMGSAAIDLAYVAAGRLDGFWELHLSPHDVAAGALLVREAGGVVTDFDGGEDWLRGGHLVAGGAAVHAALRALVRR